MANETIVDVVPRSEILNGVMVLSPENICRVLDYEGYTPQEIKELFRSFAGDTRFVLQIGGTFCHIQPLARST